MADLQVLVSVSRMAGRNGILDEVACTTMEGTRERCRDNGDGLTRSPPAKIIFMGISRSLGIGIIAPR